MESEPQPRQQVRDSSKTTDVITPIQRTGGMNADNGTRRSHHGHHFWKEISWRFTSALIFSIIIMAILYSFSRLGNLSQWEKRWFGLLAILVSSLVSLSVGSLLGLLGSMLRWHLLARKAHTPRDADLILEMANPTGALTLIWYHVIKDRKWTGTTTAVTVYLLMNIIGRFSVATFGVTFDLNERAGIDYPINTYATAGMVSVSTELNLRGLQTYTLSNSSGQGFYRKIEGGKVTYSYFLKEFRDTEQYSSTDKVLHSSSACDGRIGYNSTIYEKGKIIGRLGEINGNSDGFLRFWTLMTNYYGVNETREGEDYVWMASVPVNSTMANPPTYLYAEDIFIDTPAFTTLFECTTCLTHGKNQPGIGSEVLFGLPSANRSDITSLLLTFGADGTGSYTPLPRIDPSVGGIIFRHYPQNTKTENFLQIGYEAFGLLSYLRISGSDWPIYDVPVEAELFAAHLTARLPLFAILGADIQLPKVTRDKGASVQPYVNTVLQVKWMNAFSVLISILVGQLFAIGIVQYVCRNVFVRDHASYLSVARLLRTAMNTLDGNSTSTGVELAGLLQEEDVMMRYGTRRKDNGALEVDLWDDVENEFPDAHYR